MIRLALGAILGVAYASPTPLAAAAQLAILAALAFTVGEILSLVLDALFDGTDELE